jgi:hypothetical protein
LARRIAVLFHARDRRRDLSVYSVYYLAGFWREAGYDVCFRFGPRDYAPADLGFLHVDLSVVPRAYLELAARYPRTVNGRVRDIRKSAFSRNLVCPGDGWDGPVIVKSDLNCAGRPERLLREPAWVRSHALARRAQWYLRRLTGAPPFDDSRDYLVFTRRADVPPRYFADRRYVVERFLPEVAAGLYHTRIFQFLGDRWTCTRLSAREPVVNTAAAVHSVDVEPHPEIFAWRRRLGLDYGKLDYVERDGGIELLDVNKTVGAVRAHPDLAALRRHRAEGIASFFMDAGSGADSRGD